MYGIGLFSKMNRVSTKTLRHYDKIGLLSPARVDESTGYRFYSSESLKKIHMILALKELGLSLDEIKKVIDYPLSIELFLSSKEIDIRNEIEDLTKRLRLIRCYRKGLDGDDTLALAPIIKEIPRVIVASQRVKVNGYEEFFDIMPAMGKTMEAQGAVCAAPPYCFNIYLEDLDGDEDSMYVEICEAVEEYCQNSNGIVYKEIEGIDKALCLLHKGPYEMIGDTIDYGFKWMKDNEYEICSNIRESYIDGIWNKEDPADWLTEIQIPIREI